MEKQTWKQKQYVGEHIINNKIKPSKDGTYKGSKVKKPKKLKQLKLF